jgi:predicted amidophosphoribosyltransferase
LGGKNFIYWEKNNLKKIKNTTPQFKIKSKEDRKKNIEDSLKIKNPKKIKGKNILLFDDILTTGATLNEAKKVLKKAGAKKIVFMVIAH